MGCAVSAVRPVAAQPRGARPAAPDAPSSGNAEGPVGDGTVAVAGKGVPIGGKDGKGPPPLNASSSVADIIGLTNGPAGTSDGAALESNARLVALCHAHRFRRFLDDVDTGGGDAADRPPAAPPEAPAPPAAAPATAAAPPPEMDASLITSAIRNALQCHERAAEGGAGAAMKGKGKGKGSGAAERPADGAQHIIHEVDQEIGLPSAVDHGRGTRQYHVDGQVLDTGPSTWTEGLLQSLGSQSAPVSHSLGYSRSTRPTTTGADEAEETQTIPPAPPALSPESPRCPRRQSRGAADAEAADLHQVNKLSVPQAQTAVAAGTRRRDERVVANVAAVIEMVQCLKDVVEDITASDPEERPPRDMVQAATELYAQVCGILWPGFLNDVFDSTVESEVDEDDVLENITRHDHDSVRIPEWVLARGVRRRKHSRCETEALAAFCFVYTELAHDFARPMRIASVHNEPLAPAAAGAAAAGAAGDAGVRRLHVRLLDAWPEAWRQFFAATFIRKKHHRRSGRPTVQMVLSLYQPEGQPVPRPPGGKQA